jgi:hypothetical protein
LAAEELKTVTWHEADLDCWRNTLMNGRTLG